MSSRCIHPCWRSSKCCVIICLSTSRDQSATVSSLDCCPHVHRLYLQMNTGVPSSAAAERLFSLGGRTFHRCEQDWAVITLKCWPFCVWANDNWLRFKVTKHCLRIQCSDTDCSCYYLYYKKKLIINVYMPPWVNQPYFVLLVTTKSPK